MIAVTPNGTRVWLPTTAIVRWALWSAKRHEDGTVSYYYDGREVRQLDGHAGMQLRRIDS